MIVTTLNPFFPWSIREVGARKKHCSGSPIPPSDILEAELVVCPTKRSTSVHTLQSGTYKHFCPFTTAATVDDQHEQTLAPRKRGCVPNTYVSEIVVCPLHPLIQLTTHSPTCRSGSPHIYVCTKGI